MTNFISKSKNTRNFINFGDYSAISFFQTAILGFSAISLVVNPNVLAQNRVDFNVSVYNNVIKGDGTGQVITGDTNKRNIIFGMEGDDRITAGPNGDLIFGNQGRDTIFGGKGDDYIFGGKGLDYIYGGTGNNTIYADLDGALIWGGKGKNNIYTMPVNRPGDSVYPISYVKTGPNADNIFVELPEPSEKNGMVFVHNDKDLVDNLTMDNRYNFIQSCFIDTNQNNQTYRWNFYSFETPTNGQKVGIWILGNIAKPNYAPVSIRNYQAPNIASATVNMQNTDANNLKQDFKIPFFDMTNTKTIDSVINDCNQNRNSSTNNQRSSQNSQRNNNYYSTSYSNDYNNNYSNNNYNNNYSSRYNYSR